MQSNYEAEGNSEEVRVKESEKWEMQRQDRDSDTVEEKRQRATSIHCVLLVLCCWAFPWQKTRVTVLTAQRSQTSYLSRDLAVVIEVVEGESPLLSVIFFNWYSALQLLINKQQW